MVLRISGGEVVIREEFLAVGAAQMGSIGFGLEEREAGVAASKMINVCEYLLGDIFAPRIGAVLQTIIGGFAALFAGLISNFGDVIGDGIGFTNRYEFSAEMDAYFPINSGLFGELSCYLFDLFGALLSCIGGLISGLLGHTLVPGFGANTTHNYNFMGNANKAPASGVTGLDNDLIDRIYYPRISGLKTIIFSNITFFLSCISI